MLSCNTDIFPKSTLSQKEPVPTVTGEFPSNVIKTMDKATISGMVRKVRTQIAAGARLPVEKRQAMSVQDRGIKGPIWVSKVVLGAPDEDDLRQALFSTVEGLGNEGDVIQWPESTTVGAEWVGHRLDPVATLPAGEQERFAGMMRDVASPFTILYVHGGAFWLNSAASSRYVAARLATTTGGRCLSVDYRLAPQSPFPAALLDVLHSYLCLLAPPPGSYHSPIPASSIILAGESSGASLCLGLIQVILELRRQQGISTPIIRFNGRDIALQMPAGIASFSPEAERAICLPSCTENREHDILLGKHVATAPGFPADHIWPSRPPRANLYCDASLYSHPLISPAVVRDWTGAPPMWIAIGQEIMSDSVKIVAQTAARQGVCVLWEEYEAMPHTWPMIFPKWPQSTRCYQGFAQACKRFITSHDPTSTGAYIKVGGQQVDSVNVRELTPLGIQDALRLIIDAAQQAKPWTGGHDAKALL